MIIPPAMLRTVLFTVLFASACVFRLAPEPRGDVHRLDTEVVLSGRDDFLRACAPCHGVGGRGDGPVAPALKTKVPDLTTLAARAGGRFPRERVLDVLTGSIPVTAHGTREMPVWSDRFSPSDAGAAAAASIYARRWLEALVAHMESIQRATNDVGPG